MSIHKPGRNDPCPCGSGKKYKQCCQQRQDSQQQAMQAAIPQALRNALIHQRTGNTAQAEAIYRQIIQVSPGQPDALNLLGVIALQSGRIEEAIQRIGRAIRVNPANPEYHSNIGFAYHEQGQLDLAATHYRKAIALNPGFGNALYNLHALLLTQKDLPQAIESLRNVLKLNPADLDARTMLAVLLDYSGLADMAAGEFKTLENASALVRARVDAWLYLKSAARPLPVMTGSMIETFKLAFAAAPEAGLILEFGVRFGNTIRQIAGLVRQPVHGFDSFEGLPEQWHQEAKGSYSTRGELPVVPRHVTLHAGWFEDTLPLFLQQHQGPIRLINVDCDIYSSTKTVLEQLAPRMVVGSVIVFDEYIGNEHWREDEFKAFQEAVASYGWSYEYLCFSLFTKQVAVRITGIAA